MIKIINLKIKSSASIRAINYHINFHKLDG